jgi:hypothetical protein
LLLARVRGWGAPPSQRDKHAALPDVPAFHVTTITYETFGEATVPLMSSMILKRAPNRPVRITEAGRRELAEIPFA